jgi:RNA polymerase sigma factor (sigma-70 family)
MEHKTDTELVTLALSGNKDAFGQLVERYQPMAQRVALGMVAHEDIARELVQEAILQAYLSLDRLRDTARFKSWLYGIVLNVCRSYIREQKTNPFSLEALMGGMRCDTFYGLDAALDPEEVAEEHELHRIVLHAVHTLSEKERAATLLFYYEQLSLQEIAAILGISVVAVKGRLHKSRKQLKELLLPLYADYGAANARERRRKAMVKVRIATVLKNTKKENHWVVVLLDEAGHRILNIWVVASDALAIALGLTAFSTPRPMTLQFMHSLLKETGIKLEEVRIETLKDEVFYAVAKFRNGNAVHEIDARPSDAMALAALNQSPIYVAEEVFERAGLALPEEKSVQLAYGMHFMQQELEEVFSSHPQSRLTDEQCKQANQQFIAFLTGETVM